MGPARRCKAVSARSLRLECFGHACFGVSAQGHASLLLDPHAPGLFNHQMNYPKPQGRFDAVVCSHEHLDHAAVDGFDAEVLDSGEFGGWTIQRIEVDHDEYDGRRRGGRVDMLSIRGAGCHIVHASDVGQSPTPDVLDALGAVDVLLVPVGGFFTVGAAQAWAWCERVAARCVVPMHHKTSECLLPLMPVSTFLTYVDVYERKQRAWHFDPSAALPPCVVFESF